MPASSISSKSSDEQTHSPREGRKTSWARAKSSSSASTSASGKRSFLPFGKKKNKAKSHGESHGEPSTEQRPTSPPSLQSSELDKINECISPLPPLPPSPPSQTGLGQGGALPPMPAIAPSLQPAVGESPIGTSFLDSIPSTPIQQKNGNDEKTEAPLYTNDAFLKALRGSTSMDENDGDGNANEDLSDFPDRERSDEDNAFLSALQMSTSTRNKPASTDFRFTPAVRERTSPPLVESDEMVSSLTRGKLPMIRSESNISTSNVDESPSRSTWSQGSQPSKPTYEKQQEANAAFLGALHATADVGETGSDFSSSVQAMDGAGSFVVTSKPPAKGVISKLPKSKGGRRVQPPKKLQGAPTKDGTQGAQPLETAQLAPQSIDSDAEFLMAVRGNSSVVGSFSSDNIGDGAGTLVLNSPAKGTKANKRDGSVGDAFMMNFHVPAEDDGDASEILNREESAMKAHGVRAEDNSSDVIDEGNKSDSESDDDDLMEDVIVPQKPYMEKVLLPRPLFFGHELPPRVLEEARHAISLYDTRREEDMPHRISEMTAYDDALPGKPPVKSSHALPPSPVTTTTAEISPSESFTSSASSLNTMTSMSAASMATAMATGGTKELFESPIPPCCRNLEGALDVFGFGVNPFTESAPDRKMGENCREECVEAPHPYVSIYSPVWEEWARAARVKARRKMARRLDKEAKATVEPRKARKQRQKSWSHKKCMSVDSVSSNSSFSSIEKGAALSDNSSKADNLFLQFARSAGEGNDEIRGDAEDGAASPSAQTASGDTDFSQDQFLKFACGAGEETAAEDSNVSDDQDNANNLFLKYARGAGEETGAASPSAQTASDDTDLLQDQFLKFARGGESTDDNTFAGGAGTFINKAAKKAGAKQVDTEESSSFSQDQFLKHVRAGAGGNVFDVGNNISNGTFVSSQPLHRSTSTPSFPQCSERGVQSDDDSLEAAEERKVVGNDNISAAVAMLAGEDADEDDADINRGIGASILLASGIGGGSKAANRHGRPYTNLELMAGCVPQFGCDDPALPHERDLGIFEAKEDENRNAVRKRERNMIEEFAAPGIMPHVACPTKCTDVDDSVTYNTRAIEGDELGISGRSTSNHVLISLDNKEGRAGSQIVYETSRCAWWNLPDSFDGSPNGEQSKSSHPVLKSKRCNHRHPSPSVEVFPATDEPVPLDVQTNLWPPTSLIHKNNFSGARAHSASSTARCLPHLSDRSPCVRHLQIDTTAVGFPKLGGEIEPMFCKLAVYHFEMSTEVNNPPPAESRRGSDYSATSAASFAPSPNFERCGRVTEVLHFDVVQDPSVINNCKNALWPYANADGGGNDLLTGISEGTSCGMFPLPANLSISNLYAVIVVNKILPERSELQPYYKPSRKDPASNDNIDLEKLRNAAKEDCEKYGHFVTPFAFGVVPLRHIVSDEAPSVPVSRAVQIPLFKFGEERGPEESIYDHILQMLHPRAETRGGKAASMTRGHALLVMRYFGYLGLHSVLKKKSSLARERLVDFTRELQVKCKGENGPRGEAASGKVECPVFGKTYVMTPWRSQYEVEPVDPKAMASRNNSYAQEIASLPLERAVPESTSRGRKSSKWSVYDNLLLHRCFCNELVCQPKILQRCFKRRVVIKVEMKELRRSESLDADVVVPLAPNIHNTRRGPWLVSESFSSCAMGAPQFIDEFKMKLPMVLGASDQGQVGIMFSVYHFNPQKKKRSILSLKASDGGPKSKLESRYSIDYLGCGFMPLTLENSPTCLIPNGDHEVHINLRAEKLPDAGEPSPSRQRQQKKMGGHFRNWSSSSDRSVVSTSQQDELKTLTANEAFPEGSLILTRLVDGTSQDNEDVSDECSSRSDSKSARSVDDIGSAGGDKEPSTADSEMVLNVNITAFSSVHPQNKTMADLFLSKPKPPRSLISSDFTESYAPWSKCNRTEILYRLKPERIPPFNFVGGSLAETERKLLEPVVSLTKSSKCPHTDLMTHLVRTVAQLWRTAVSGAGEPSLIWASPESLIPLRLNAFATLLHCVSSAAHHMAKAGLRQLDGESNWDVAALGKLLTMLFDEQSLFGTLAPLEEAMPVPEEITCSPKKSPPKPEIITRSKTADYEASDISRPNIIERYSSEESPPKNTAHKRIFDVDAMLTPSSPESKPTVGEDASRSSAAPNPLTSGEAGYKVDSKNDFMAALVATHDDEPAATPTRPTGPLAESHLFKPAASGPAANRRRWMTLPSNALQTIQENEGDDSRTGDQKLSSSIVMPPSDKHDDSIESELVVRRGEKKRSRQFRVPEVAPGGSNPSHSNDTDPFAFLDNTELPSNKEQEEKDCDSSTDKPRAVLIDDGTIEKEGTAFLDAIGKNFGLGMGLQLGGEERRVGAAHHRKTRSKCSIDWTLPPTDHLLEKEQQIENLNRVRSGNPTMPLSPVGSYPYESSDDETAGNDIVDNRSSALESEDEGPSDKEHPLKRQYPKSRDPTKQHDATVLPDFADRIISMNNDGNQKRWWPYVYEVIIHQWVTLLYEQTRKNEKKKEGSVKEKTEAEKRREEKTTGLSPIVVKYLSHAAKSSRGATIRCAPYLLEIIKKSLSWRVDCVYRSRKKMTPSLDEKHFEHRAPSLVQLDPEIMADLEHLVILLTDASIDSRNFDSFEYRKISIDVNDAVVRFIRDLFSILDTPLVHRLVLLYFARFITKEGKHWSNKDSKVTGLNCSWETTKLRLNAITLFVRFPEFMEVCSPIMESVELPSGSSAESSRRFFSDLLEKINRLGLSEFTSSDGPISKEPVTIPRMKPHWLAELCTDICLSATGHAEESIQIRASSLLFELFWRHSCQGRFRGNISVAASVFVPFVTKVLGHLDYLSSLPAKSQLRKDLLPCTLFVLQSAPVGLMRALWRKLAKLAEGNTLARDSTDKYGGINGSGTGVGSTVSLTSLLNHTSQINENFELDDAPDIFDLFSLLNLCLATIEYEEDKKRDENDGNISSCEKTWRKEFLLSSSTGASYVNFSHGVTGVGETGSSGEPSTIDTRRWYSHDCASTIINICRQIVREVLCMLTSNLVATEEAYEADLSYVGMSGSRSLSDIFLQPTSSSIEDSEPDDMKGIQHEEGKAARLNKRLRKQKPEKLSFAPSDTIIFVRAVTSVYLNALSINQSDVVITKTLTASVEIVKIFGIKLFLSALGETLQHWMRVIVEHCGARRAEVRVDACEFLNLLLRLAWDSYGSFSRIRLPLLSVQSEVMERIVGKAARLYKVEQQCLGLDPIMLSNEGAEASLTPLWRTIDRLHNQSASRNLAFKSALARLAKRMKNIFEAYLAAHALAIVSRSELRSHGNNAPSSEQPNPYVQRMRVSVHRIVSNSDWLSKRFLGKDPSSSLDRSMLQTEAVEDAFVSASEVFSSTELPSHRVAWLEKLADYYRMRGRFAEEATCRCYIYHTYREAAQQHEFIWSSSPFLPWASSDTSQDADVNSIGDGHAVVSPEFDLEDNSSGGSSKQVNRISAFRRIFYRSAGSINVRTGDWGAISGGKYLFCGVTLKSEFDSVSPWFTQREMEENMVEEAEVAGDLYLKAGIVESSRYAWSLANAFYSETFDYERLAHVYRRLALVVSSQAPIIDVSNQLDLSSQIGRFYKVYFHGSAPDDLLHLQGSEGFIYRVKNTMQIKDFAAYLENAVRCILPKTTPIDLLMDDGSPTMNPKTTGNKRVGGPPVEPVKIKVTPLRPLFKIEDNDKCFRGTPEWFQLRAEKNEYDDESDINGRKTPILQHLRSLSISTTTTISSHGSMTMPAKRSTVRSARLSARSMNNNKEHVDGELIGVDRFYFTQPMKKDPVRGFRDWLKVPKGRMAERSLRVTELTVESPFPSCKTRQKIVDRAVFTQSPLEASVEVVSTWCSVLFRTVMATNGQGVLGGQRQQGLSAESAKLIMECIHSSGVKRIGLTFLAVNAKSEESDDSAMYNPYESLDEDEIEIAQTKLARMIVTFLELLHLLIARNRDVLLTVVQARKRRGGGDASSVASGSIHGGYAATPRAGTTHSFSNSPMKRQSTDVSGMYDRSSESDFVGRSIIAENNDRTDSAIGVQSELQRGFISLVKGLSSILLDTLNSEIPRWMRTCHQDSNYFSTGQYRHANIPIGDELFFTNVDSRSDDKRGDDQWSKSGSSHFSAVPRSIRGTGHPYRENSPSGSLCSGASDRRYDRSNHRRNISGASFASLRGAL